MKEMDHRSMSPMGQLGPWSHVIEAWGGKSSPGKKMNIKGVKKKKKHYESSVTRKREEEGS